MFADRPRAARELVRVCRPGGRVLATEFYWRRPPTPEARQVFLGEVCPGVQLDNRDDWVRLYEQAGLTGVEAITGPFDMMTAAGFLHDEGWANSAAVMAHALAPLLPAEGGLVDAARGARGAGLGTGAPAPVASRA